MISHAPQATRDTRDTRDTARDSLASTDATPPSPELTPPSSAPSLSPQAQYFFPVDNGGRRSLAGKSKAETCRDSRPPLTPAQQKIVADNLGLTYTFAKQYHVPYHFRDDLVQAATLGLMVAAQEYTPARGTFSTFAYFCMRSEIHFALSKELSFITIPLDWTYRGTAKKRAEANPNWAAAKSIIHLSSEGCKSHQDDRGDAGTVTSELSFGSWKHQQRQHRNYKNHQDYLRRAKRLAAFVTKCQSLTDRERELWELWLEGGRNFREIGEVMGVSPKRAAQIFQQILEMVRGELKRNKRLREAVA